MNEFEIKGRYFFDIFNGKKTAEGRNLESRFGRYVLTRDWKFVKLLTRIPDDLGQPGIILSFDVKLDEAFIFDSVDDMLSWVGIEKMLPGTTTIEEGKKIYQQFNVTGKVMAIYLHPISKLEVKPV